LKKKKINLREYLDKSEIGKGGLSRGRIEYPEGQSYEDKV
jgi:hypothetical protein